MIDTTLSPSDVKRRLSEVTDAGVFFASRPFFGTVSDNTFFLRRTPRGTTSFLLEFVGEVQPAPPGSQIHFVARVSLYNLIALAIILVYCVGWWLATGSLIPLLGSGVGIGALWVFEYRPASIKGAQELQDALRP